RWTPATPGPPTAVVNQLPASASVSLPLLFATKLYLPAPRAGLVSRLRLVQQLQASLRCRLTLISAPAGFGKTTVLSAWLEQTQVHHAWLALDAGDNDPVGFLQYVIAAIQTAHPGLGSVAQGMLASPQPAAVEAVVAMLINELARLEQDLVLVLDDYHVIEAQPIHRAVTFLVDHLPARLHLVMSSRADPPLPLSRLRSRGELGELRAADLRFTPEEAAAFLTACMGLPLSAADVAALEARTEGWIAGLQFAALAMRNRADLAGFVRAFTGSNRFVIDYLVEEVLARQPAHVHEFLLRTSILDRMCGSLCDAVLLETELTARPDLTEAYSQVVLLELERTNLFLVPLDDERQWYRYHHLFADVLRTRLRHGAGAQVVAELHQRAARWYEQVGLVPEAVHHALAAEDWEHSARLITHSGVLLAGRGQIHMVLRWLDAHPPEFMRTHPALTTMHAFLLLAVDQLSAAEACLLDAERWARENPSDDRAPAIQREVALHRATIARCRGDLARCVALGHEVLNLDPTDVGARLHTAHAFLVTGDVTVEHERLVASAMAELCAGSRVFLSAAVRSIVLLARLQNLQGRLRMAAARYDEVMKLTEGDEGLRLLPSALCYYAGLGDLHREWGRLQSAEQLLRQGLDLLGGTLTPDADWMALGSIALSRVQQARGDSAGADATLERFADLAHQRKFAAHLIARAAAAQARLALARGDLSVAVRWTETSGVQAGDEVDYPREDEYLTLVRVHIAQARAGSRHAMAGGVPPETLHLLDRLLQRAESSGRIGSVIEILSLQALAWQSQGDLARALAALAHALLLAEPEGYVRVFADEGPPMAALLGEAARRGSAPPYVARLLQACGEASTLAGPRAATDPGPRAPAPLDEPLSKRELEVLHLMAAGKSNAEIARALVIAITTVKAHANSIFGKLGVRSRTQAIAQARELHLL
ncbi:MAG TPA: LuxR C-terminal-related transcriptional regulator, partial [Herpetosiphonaceae bacterium]|nr:LuxR C-terminal-related transcriptional regulator [Herpetosiphonaceae bacterium]